MILVLDSTSVLSGFMIHKNNNFDILEFCKLDLESEKKISCFTTVITSKSSEFRPIYTCLLASDIGEFNSRLSK